MHQNTRYNIIQARNNSNLWVVIDGQRMPAGYPAKGARIVSVEMSYADAIALADSLQATADRDAAITRHTSGNK